MHGGGGILGGGGCVLCPRDYRPGGGGYSTPSHGQHLRRTRSARSWRAPRGTGNLRPFLCIHREEPQHPPTLPQATSRARARTSATDDRRTLSPTARPGKSTQQGRPPGGPRAGETGSECPLYLRTNKNYLLRRKAREHTGRRKRGLCEG